MTKNSNQGGPAFNRCNKYWVTNFRNSEAKFIHLSFFFHSVKLSQVSIAKEYIGFCKKLFLCVRRLVSPGDCSSHKMRFNEFSAGEKKIVWQFEWVKLTKKHCISHAVTLLKQPLAVETWNNTYTPSSGASVFFESACGEHSVFLYCFFSHPPTPLHNSCLSSLFPCLSWSINQHHYIRGCSLFHGLLSSLGHTDPSGAAPWALIPLFLSRVGLAPPLSPSLAWALRPPPPPLSLSLSLADAGLAPPSHVGSAPTSVLCTAGAAPLSPGRYLARDTPPPACPKILFFPWCLSDWSSVIHLCDGSKRTFYVLQQGRIQGTFQALRKAVKFPVFFFLTGCRNSESWSRSDN